MVPDLTLLIIKLNQPGSGKFTCIFHLFPQQCSLKRARLDCGPKLTWFHPWQAHGSIQVGMHIDCADPDLILEHHITCQVQSVRISEERVARSLTSLVGEALEFQAY